MICKDLITKGMITALNNKLSKQGTCLRVVENGKVFGGVKQYKLKIVDPFMDSSFMIPNPNKECEELVRGFFRSKGIELPYSNQVLDIWAYKEEI